MTESARTLETEPGFWIDVDQSATVSIVTVAGDVDLHSAPFLRTRLAGLIDEHVDDIVLDLSGVTFLDSMALGVILAAKKRIATEGGRLDLVVATPEVRRIFEITMLDQVFDLHETRADAVRGGGEVAG